LSRALAIFRLLRPVQWAKNGFVLVGLLFGHALGEPDKVQAALVAFAAFCAMASAVYVVNDWFDREADRRHPLKRFRPIASGRVSGRLAALVTVVALAFAYGLCMLPALVLRDGTEGGARLAILLSTYLAMNIAYTFRIKHVPILDCAVIASGYMLRIFAGTWAIGIAPSRWLIVCSLSLTLFLAFAKRRAELEVLGGDAGGHRRVLQHYSLPLLDQFLAITATAVLVTYSVYAVSAETVAIHGTDRLFWTVPFVLYGLFRYLYLVFQRGAGGDPTGDLARDPHLVVSAVAWFAATTWVLQAGA
jgi:4-hydroxybenzoate polyprenyltransferase